MADRRGEACYCPFFSLNFAGRLDERSNEAARVHHPPRRRGGGVAAGGEGAAAGKLPTIGFLGAATPSTRSQWTAAFVQRLRELGWIEGRTVAIEYRWAEGRNERFAEIAAEFVRLKVDVIVTAGTRSPRGKAGDIGHPDRLRDGGGPGWQRPRRESGATGRQRHRPVDPADRSCRQASRTLARGCPRSPPVGDLGQCRQSRRRAGDGRGSGSGPHARPRGRHVRNPASRGYRARLRGAQGPRGRALCRWRPAHGHQPGSHQHLGAGRATADDVQLRESTSKREA